MKIRSERGSDLDFLTAMLSEAVNWSGHRLNRQQIEADPGLVRYVSGWPRPEDFGVVAVDAALGPIGAAWARLFTADDPGFGYVADDVPEVSMAVVPGRRGEGVGRRLLAALIDRARSEGWRQLSLSVEDGNRAAELYRAFGFTVAGRNGSSDTITLSLEQELVSS
jgi:GNAT superfamily N-acetyltransferase